MNRLARVVLCSACIALLPGVPAVHGQEASRGIPATDVGVPGSGPIRRAEWFQKTWNGRRDQFLKSAKDEQGALVVFGDSITQGWGDRLKKFFPGAKIANRGISGDTTRGMLYRFKEDVLDLNPTGVVMLMGTNDLAESATAAQIVGNIKLMILQLKAKNPSIAIVLCTMFPSSPTKERPAEKIKEVNNALLAAVKGDSSVIVVDTWAMFANAEGNAPAELFPDLLHLNDAGYEKWASALRPVLETYMLIPVPADDFKPEAGFVSLFNGRDLTGWGVQATPEETIKQRENVLKKNPNGPVWPIFKESKSFDSQIASDDGRYVARNGRIVVMTPAEGRRIQTLSTTKEFPKDFTLRLEFRATPNADSGVFLRKPQLQCRDYTVAGPYKNLKNYKPQDWNVLEVVAKGGVARCTCNGEVLEEAFKIPETGPIGLEGDRGQMEYRRIRIKTEG
ncbi:GDSL-like Lipase/Acylhydrolase [Caulifigura coniformis]|uniref:GDSL-like Lipase/Acylhydrolase n=1 Tax=Caulifigura coniformis TaxID=2527983 RepID=A0A517SAT5_9PLAN|nr:GDSL-type esterase/lipase family protein [Caulifigura coniformis]QDT53247.1 GDSL-like Lipase/Acylhydrolase [Caulifigura coniformis]